MSNQPIIVPLALNHTNQCTITPPWFVNHSEYHPLVATFAPLVNGEEAFGAVYRAIDAAKKSVSIICWGFQPSMYFVRSAANSTLPIGALLEKKAMQGVQVRVLCYAVDPLWTGIDTTGKMAHESNVPGRHALSFGDDRPPRSSDEQYRFDQEWYLRYDTEQTIADMAYKNARGMDGERKTQNLLFLSRGFSPADRAGIALQDHADQGLSGKTKRTLSAAPSHHQKMVLVDYDDPGLAVGFVMGHNMLDEYWDTSAHSYHRHDAADQGRNGTAPRHDFSSRVAGPILGDLFSNFAQAWEKERTLFGLHVEKLPRADFSAYPPGTGQTGQIVMAQLLRTQPQYGVQDIKRGYLQAVNNATRYIHIENQYFRWPPLADKIKAAAEAQTAWGRCPEKHGVLHVFVITNANNEGIGFGSVNTYRMLDSLGQADTIPGVARAERADDLEARLGRARHESWQCQQRYDAAAAESARWQASFGVNEQASRRLAQDKAALDTARARETALKDDLAEAREKNAAVLREERPGLKIHVCTLVAPDTPEGMAWKDVYVHAKLMLVDDAFMTLGSANINTRSMEVDSELNIAHHRPEVTQPLRKKLWGMHTNGMGAQEEPAEAFRAWEKIINDNKYRRLKNHAPTASLIEFYRDDPERTNSD